MNRTDFTAALELDLQLTGPFGRAAVLRFVEDCWGMIEDSPDPVRWAEAFHQATAEAMV